MCTGVWRWANLCKQAGVVPLTLAFRQAVCVDTCATRRSKDTRNTGVHGYMLCVAFDHMCVCVDITYLLRFSIITYVRSDHVYYLLLTLNRARSNSSYFLSLTLHRRRSSRPRQ